MDTVREARAAGCLIGSCSDRTVSNQQLMWADHGVDVDFTVLKHRLSDLKDRFHADAYYHIGDTETDQFYAERAGFYFIKPGDSRAGLWDGAG